MKEDTDTKAFKNINAENANAKATQWNQNAEQHKNKHMSQKLSAISDIKLK